MKILIIHNQYQQAGGESVAVQGQISLLQEHHHEVIYYTRDNKEIERFNAYQKFNFAFQTIYSVRTKNEIENLIKLEHPDIAHVHNVFPLISPSVYDALNRAKIPIVQTIHNFRFLCPNGLFYINNKICERCLSGNTLNAVLQKCFRESHLLSAEYALAIGLHRQIGTFKKIDKFIALSNFSAIKLIQSGLITGEQIQILGNFLPEPLPRVGNVDENGNYIVFIGRLSPEKGVEFLIEAMQDLPEITLKIIGAGELSDSLQTKVKQKAINNIEFLGYITGGTKWELLRKAKICVIPSVCYETFSIAALESLSVGTPVIASNHGSLPFIIDDHKNGLLFEPGNRNDLQQKIKSLFNNNSELNRMGQNGYQKVKQKFTANSHYQSLMEIYNELLGESL